MEIKAAVLHEQGGLMSIESVELAVPKESEVLVKVVATGICHSDEWARGALPLAPVVLGHEGAGIVKKVGSKVKGLSVGDHVVLTYAHCGTCEYCLNNQPYACPDLPRLLLGGRMHDGTTRLSQGDKELNNFFGQGSFASYAVVDATGVVKVDKEVDLTYLAGLGCGFQTGMGTTLGTLNARKDSTIAILGCGPVGFSAIIGAAIAGCKNIIAVGGTPDKLDLALEIGATHVINRKEFENWDEEIRKINPMGADYVVETTGAPQMVETGLKALANAGHFAFVSVYQNTTIDPTTLILKAQTLYGSSEGCVDPYVFIPQMVTYIKEGRFPVEKITKLYDLADIETAFAEQRAGKVIKPIIVMPE